MNLADTVKVVLKTKTQYILKNFIKKDLIIILNTTRNDILGLGRFGYVSIISLKGGGIKNGLEKILNIGPDLVFIIKEIPQRVRTGFFRFKEEFIIELDKASDQKQKRKLCIKVIGALVRMTIPKEISLTTNLSVSGVISKTPFTHFIVFKLINKISQIFVFRLLEVVEEELSQPEDLENVRYFKDLITGESVNYSYLQKIEHPSPEEASFYMLKNLEQFLMTGRA